MGVLHLISDPVKDLEFLLNEPPAPPYSPVIPTNFFTRENILKLRESKFISAIVVIDANKTLEQFSQESKCPNQFMTYTKEPTCDSNNPWNPFGTGLLLENFDIPIYYLYDKNETQKIVDCFRTFNNFDFKTQNERSLCSIQIKTFMSAASNSEVCLRRSRNNHNMAQTKYCDPLQGRNVYGTLFPRKLISLDNRSVDVNEKFILVSARFDTTSMFDGVGLGAMDSLVSFATLISSAHYLRKLTLDLDKPTHNILFVLFNGESYDYIGSQRFVYDLKKGIFPEKVPYHLINFTNIEMMIDIGTLDNPNNLLIYHTENMRDQVMVCFKFEKIYRLIKFDNDFLYRSKSLSKIWPLTIKSTT